MKALHFYLTLVHNAMCSIEFFFSLIKFKKKWWQIVSSTPPPLRIFLYFQGITSLRVTIYFPFNYGWSSSKVNFSLKGDKSSLEASLRVKYFFQPRSGAPGPRQPACLLINDGIRARKWKRRNLLRRGRWERGGGKDIRWYCYNLTWDKGLERDRVFSKMTDGFCIFLRDTFGSIKWM